MFVKAVCCTAVLFVVLAALGIWLQKRPPRDQNEVMTDDFRDLIGRLEEQERRLTFDRFDNADAWALGCLLVDLATGRDLPVAVDIRRGTQQLFHAALPGSTADNDAWIERKVRVVLAVRGVVVPGRAAAGGQGPGAGRGHGCGSGAVRGARRRVPGPGAVRGVVGVVTVSGLPQAEDHALVVEAIEAYLAAD